MSQIIAPEVDRDSAILVRQVHSAGPENRTNVVFHEFCPIDARDHFVTFGEATKKRNVKL